MEVSEEVKSAIIGAIVTVLVSVVSWYVGFRTAVRAQRGLLVDQIRAQALERISGELERTQALIEEAFNAVHSIRFVANMAAHGKDVDLAGVRTSPPTFSRLMPPYAWVSLLTQYVQIFPETGNVRHELARRVEAFAAQLARFDTEVLTVFQSELNRKQMGVRLVSIVEAQLHDMRAGMDVINAT